jgi:sarcosine oxidase
MESYRVRARKKLTSTKARAWPRPRNTCKTARSRSIIVVGAGAFGGWTALKLAQRGAKVTLLDAWGPGNSRASSGGETRTIRATYGPAHGLYVKMVARALQLRQEYERRWSLKLFFRGGALRMAGPDDSYESAALPVLKEAGIRFDKLSAADCSRRWPQMNFDGVSRWAGRILAKIDTAHRK